MSDTANVLIQLALSVAVLLLLPCAYRAIVGPSMADRLLALDVITTRLISIILLLALALESSLVVDIALALAAFGFIATLALARYLSEGRVF